MYMGVNLNGNLSLHGSLNGLHTVFSAENGRWCMVTHCNYERRSWLGQATRADVHGKQHTANRRVDMRWIGACSPVHQRSQRSIEMGHVA
jgi:hypothetical protein